MTRQHEVTGGSFIPDLCRGRALFPLLVISQLVAIVLVMAAPVGQTSLIARLVLVSLYLHWISLSSAAVLCFLRHHFAGLPVVTVSLLCYIVLLAVTLAISEAAFWVGYWMRWPDFHGQVAHTMFILRNVMICAIVAALVLRYFYVMDAWQRQVQALANARYQALQARIRPHFLFNSLNSIAALIPIRPDDAERLVEDLADVFRAILGAKQALGNLERELQLTRSYLDIEQLRLADRLRVIWDIPDDLLDCQLPLLSLQPLVENAIYHGIELLPAGGSVTIRGRRDAKVLRLEVRNPIPEQGRGQGSRSAQENIRQRLRLLFDDRAGLVTQRDGSEYSAVMEVPLS